MTTGKSLAPLALAGVMLAALLVMLGAKPRTVAAPAAEEAALPTLEQRIDAAEIIGLATTTFYGEDPFYVLNETWKSPATWIGADREITMHVAPAAHTELGHTPRHNQQVVLFYTEQSWHDDAPLAMLAVADGTLTYAPEDPTLRRTLKVEELRRLVKRRGAGK